ncbi:hypothetical protein GCM10010399_79120 [Dactylosporangium fulvum]|uniref:Protein kinase domain-containing protein n=1 Tax=Dactylosporangium fulvum TaxID=53359 RepID=A0ABY5W288_9ACTN|nr:hypothetical protein [Dactylosporangium fulvum]UWP83221.1 hypothetical protein Dfulv_02625 [Dactylosporangium fulvum]
MAGPPLTVADLGRLGPALGSGGQAVVYDAPALHLQNAPGQLVYKEYKPGKAPRRGDVLSLITLRDQLGPADRDRLDGIATWPLRAVTDGPDLRGVVLPRIPGSFFQPVTTPSGKRKTWVREVQHLFVDPDRCQRVGMPVPSWEQRLTICRDFAAALDFLHGPAVDVVFGDINAKNELFRLDKEPTVMFVDCDAVRRRGVVTGEPQLNAPDWEPPNRTSLNRSTDLYKLALFVLRCLTTPGDQASTRTDPAEAAGVLDTTGRALLDAALLGPAAQRPEAADWLHYLSRLLGRPLDPPQLVDVAIDRTVVPAGEPVTISWTTTDAVTVEVIAPGHAPVVADARSGAGTTQVRPARSGQLTVTARNDHGADSRRTPPVAVYDLPDWSALPVPSPQLHLDAVALPPMPDLRAALALHPPPIPESPSHVTVPTAAPVSGRMPDVDLNYDAPIDLVSLMLAGPPTMEVRR